MAIKSKTITFRPTQGNIEILDTKVNNSYFDRTGFINYLIENYPSNFVKMQELQQANRAYERMKEANDFADMSMFKDERLAKEKVENQLKTANVRIDELTLQSNEFEQLKKKSVQHQERIEILKSKNEFLNAHKSVMDKSTLNELETLRAKVAEQEKEIFHLTEKDSYYENEYLNKAFEEVKGNKVMVQHGKVNETFIINAKHELVKALSYKYFLYLSKD